MPKRIRVIITRRFKRYVQAKARRIIARCGFELSEAEWLLIAPCNTMDVLFASTDLISYVDILEAVILNMLARARRLGLRPRLRTVWDLRTVWGYMYLIEAERDGYAHLIDT